MDLIKILGVVYLGLLVGSTAIFFTTNFIPAKGLWRLVPFRVSGWRSFIFPRRIYNIQWLWEKATFEDYREEV